MVQWLRCSVLVDELSLVPRTHAGSLEPLKTPAPGIRHSLLVSICTVLLCIHRQTTCANTHAHTYTLARTNIHTHRQTTRRHTHTHTLKINFGKLRTIRIFFSHAFSLPAKSPVMIHINILYVLMYVLESHPANRGLCFPI